MQSPTSTQVEVKQNVPVPSPSLKSTDQLSIGQVAERSGLAVSALALLIDGGFRSLGREAARRAGFRS